MADTDVVEATAALAPQPPAVPAVAPPEAVPARSSRRRIGVPGWMALAALGIGFLLGRLASLDDDEDDDSDEDGDGDGDDED